LVLIVLLLRRLRLMFEGVRVGREEKSGWSFVGLGGRENVLVVVVDEFHGGMVVVGRKRGEKNVFVFFHSERVVVEVDAV